MVITLVKSLCKKSSRAANLPRKARIRHQGKIYHLKALFDEVNKLYFNGEALIDITWSASSIRGAARCRRLGCYVPGKKLIRISQILDDPEIPYYFIAFIVYHEMLHHFYPPFKKRGKKREIHHREFRLHEKRFKEYEQVKAWEKEVGKKKFFLE